MKGIFLAGSPLLKLVSIIRKLYLQGNFDAKYISLGNKFQFFFPGMCKLSTLTLILFPYQDVRLTKCHVHHVVGT